MVMNPDDLRRIREIAFAYSDGPLSADEVRELDELLSQGAESVAEYVACMKLHARLGRVLSGLGRSTTLPEFVAMPPEADLSIDLKQETDAVNYPRRRRLLYAALALAASLLAAGFLGLSSSGSEEISFIARVIDKIDCDWETERWGANSAAEIAQGSVLKLNRGLMMIEFGDGAKVTLEGPAQFEVVSPSRGFLHAGKLTAQVPERAQGFTVGTPSCESVDLGTEFGLKVFEDGTAETHVFEGEVVLKQATAKDAPASADVHLRTSMAARVDGKSFSLSEYAAKPKAFTQLRYEDSIGPMTPDTSSLPDNKDLVLWLDAGRQVQTDELGRVSSWGDLLYADNASREDAWQVRPSKRPLLAQQAFGNRAGIRFGGEAHLVTAPLATGNDVTVFVVFRGHEQKIRNKKAAMLINFNGPPNIVVSRSRKNELMGRMYSGYHNGVAEHGSWLRKPVIKEQATVVAAYVYSMTANRSALYANGELCETGLATKPAAVKSPKYIGRNHFPKGHFVGDIGELLIFNSAFEDRDCIQVSKLLLDKYEVANDIDTISDE